MIYEVQIEGKNYRLQLDRSEERWTCGLDGREIRIDAIMARPDVLSILVDGKAYEIKRERSALDTHLWVGSERYLAELRDPRSLRSRRSGAEDEKGPRKL